MGYLNLSVAIGDDGYEVICKDATYHSDECIISVGRSGSKWMESVCRELNISTKSNRVDIGVRVELPAAVFAHLTDELYESKIVYRTEKYGDKVRTFCMNPKGAVVEEFVRAFEEESGKLEGISFLAQGTIYPDILESDGVKAHHNVGGLPEDFKFEGLVEPVKLLYKDEVRVVGKALGLPTEMVDRQPFPGPGLGVRCTGAITRDRLHALRESDAILREEFDIAGLTEKVWQFFTVVPDITSTGVKDGKRLDYWPVIIRAVNTVDAMHCTVPRIDWEVLEKITNRILSEVDGVCRVCYDMSPKPIATIEWE